MGFWSRNARDHRGVRGEAWSHSINLKKALSHGLQA